MTIAILIRKSEPLFRSVFMLTLVVPLLSYARPADDHAGAIDSLLAAYDSLNAPGASVVVIREGTVMVKKGYGCADLESRRKIGPSTNFRLASMTKQFTAMCVMMLKEQGRLSYADPLTAFFPAFPAYGRAITVRHLLTHTSGLPDYEALIPDSQSVQILDEGVLELLMRTDSAMFPPGARYEYSNTGYALLALIVEKASGERFAEFLERHIFSPLGMRTTVAFERGVSEVKERAFGYTRTDSGFVFADQSVSSAVLGDGGVYSNADDLARWDSSLYTDALVPLSALAESFADAALADGSPVDYGYGWHKGEFLGIRYPYHNGSTRGFRNTILRFPERRLTVFILTNRNEGDPMDIAKRIAEMYLKKK